MSLFSYALLFSQARKVEVVADPRINARRPRREVIVEMTLGDGTQVSDWVRDVRGTAVRPSRELIER